jgi:hypothetical protein
LQEKRAGIWHRTSLAISDGITFLLTIVDLVESEARLSRSVFFEKENMERVSMPRRDSSDEENV